MRQLTSILFFVFLTLCLKAQKFEKTLNVYRNGISVLELSGKIENESETLNLVLPDSVIQESIEVLSRQQKNLKNVRVVSVVEEERTVIKNKQEFLLANIGQMAELEVVEGSETINYEGEILPLEPESKVLLLKSESYLRMIPIEQIAHVSIQGDAKMSTEKIISSYKLVIEFEKTNAINHLTIRIPISGIGWSPTYNINLSEGKLSSLATITNKSLSEEKISVALMDAPYLEPGSDKYSGESIIEWENLVLYKDEILQKILMEEIVGTSLKHGGSLEPVTISASDSLERKSSNIRTRQFLPVFNNSKQIWPSGSLQIVEGNKSRFSMFPLLYPDKGEELDLGPSELEVMQEFFIEKIHYEAPNPEESGKRKQNQVEPRITGYEVGMKLQINNPYPKPVFYLFDCETKTKEKGFELIKGRQDGSPVMLINGKIEVKGNISAIKTSNFTYSLEYQWLDLQ